MTLTQVVSRFNIIPLPHYCSPIIEPEDMLLSQSLGHHSDECGHSMCQTPLIEVGIFMELIVVVLDAMDLNQLFRPVPSIIASSAAIFLP